MRFTPVTVAGGWVIDQDRHQDPRGWFARVWCEHEFKEHGLDTRIAQQNLSHNEEAGTLRGLHWQEPPHAEIKLVRCVRGALWDVMVDLRPDSPTYLRHFGTELTAENGRALYIPEGCAHGFVTLQPDTDIYYSMSAAYFPAAQRGARWDDPAFGIAWPVKGPVIHPRDATYPDFAPVVRR